MIFLRHHLDENLKMEYLTVKDPLTLWNNLKDRYDHLKMVILPQAHFDWLHLRLQDFKFIKAYNFAMFKIISQLKLCGENITDHDMLEKTFSTFPASSMLLQQYREMKFKKYYDLISHLLVAEQHNELLMKNHERAILYRPIPEVNEANFRHSRRGRGRGPGRGHGRGRGRNFNHDSRIAPNNTLIITECKKKEEKHEVAKEKFEKINAFDVEGRGIGHVHSSYAKAPS
ncbi:uncharacterized protein LOC132043979 [Lycium ferocissimum]|uniref:uncharacterized protein LOC132043979 n=1 Tax=Lycium ferocissimum TaxID=112874 RepID=UPI0028150BBB|nr:uncharacterized protein LOC132043979 [Lycium ferocissimum]